MGCGGCNQRRIDLGAAVQAAASGDFQTAAAKLGNVGRTMAENTAALTRAAGQRFAYFNPRQVAMHFSERIPHAT